MKPTLAVDAHKKRFVSICDIDGAYLHAHMDEFVVIKFEGNMADLLIHACPQYKKFFHITNDGRKVLNIRP